ncbi:MAG TPA: efflux RND transporter periplasmic adaptor subunit [Bryobacteraceae bacterium]|nr:efflux RND transporter periplasmic adaptor subunit [Bryobacteraceae bacterium]
MFLPVRAVPALVLLLFLSACTQGDSHANTDKRGGLPPTPVTTAQAEMRDIPIQVRQIGSVEPVAVIAVKAQINGELQKVFFTEGQDIKKGQELFEIDPRPYQQALDQAQAALEKDTALVAQAEANMARDKAQAANAKAQAKRYAGLAAEGVISKDQNDAYQTTSQVQDEAVRADQAALTSAQASVVADRSAIETAKLNLSYCYIRSPIDGRAGSLLLQAGNLVKANDTTAMVNINQLEPVYVSFSAPEQLLPEIRRYSAGRALAVSATSVADGSTLPLTATGRLTFIDNSVDSSTGTIKLKATFPNTDHALWPGQFVNAVMTLRTVDHAIVIPSEAVQAGQKGQFAFVVKPDQTVESRVVTVGETIDNQIVVQSGIMAGETVVTDGQLRLFPGAHIRVVPAAKADAGA